MRTRSTILLSLMVIGASLLFLMFSTCAFIVGPSAGGRGAFIVGALVALAVIVGGVYGLKRINQRNVE